MAADTPTVETPAVQPEFRQDRYTEDRGDVATVGIGVGNRSTVTLRIEPTNASPSQYSAEVDVHDRNGDGRDDVRLDTYAMGHEASPISASGTDTVDVRQSADLDHRLRVGAYRLVLESADGSVAESTLVVEPAVLETLRVRTANGSQPANFSSRATIEAAIENGTFGDDRRFSTGDTLLVELEAPGLSGPLASQPGPNATVRFLNLFDAPPYSGSTLTIHEGLESVGTSEDSGEFGLTPAATTVVADPANDTYYVLLAVGRMPHHDDGEPGEPNELENGDVFRVNVTVAPTSGVYETSQSLVSKVTYVGRVKVEPSIAVDLAANQTVEIGSNFRSASGIRVVLRSDKWSQSARTVEVDDGTLVVTFDLSNRSRGESLTLVVEHEYHGVLYSEQDVVHVGSPTPTPSAPTGTATATENPPPTPGSTPGFGSIVALVAIVVAVGITVHRGRN